MMPPPLPLPLLHTSQLRPAHKQMKQYTIFFKDIFQSPRDLYWFGLQSNIRQRGVGGVYLLTYYCGLVLLVLIGYLT
jgi:hypothetical protein